MDDPTATITSDIASFTSSVVEAITTSLADWPGDVQVIDTGNGTKVDYGHGTSITYPDEPISEGSYILNTILGLIIVLIASVLNAFGLNLTKLDHVRQQGIPKRERRKEYLRGLWLAGIGTYIISQVFGSPLALRYLRPDWVAPLGSSSLVFNFLFARWLVGTPVTPTDIRGTAVIVLGVILIMVFSSINHGLEQSISVARLNSLWTRPDWLAYFVFLLLFTFSTYLTSHLFSALLTSRASYSPLPSPTMELPTSRPRRPSFFARIAGVFKRLEHSILVQMERILARADEARIVWLQGIGWAVAGGSLAGLCLVFTKAVVKIFGLPGHPLVHPSAFLTLLLVIVTAVLQIVCLNRALKCADTVVVVPLFYAGYTVFGFINSLIFYNEATQYARWVLIATFLSIAVLISGVVLLSLKSSAKAATDPYTIPQQAGGPASSIHLRPRKNAKMGSGIDHGEEEEGEAGEAGPSTPGGRRGGEEVMWEVGSMSDDESESGRVKLGTKATGGNDEEEDDEAKERRGIGGGRGSTGERRGLLVDDDEGEGEDEHHHRDGLRDDLRVASGETNPFADTRRDEEEDGFGAYEGVRDEEDRAAGAAR